MNTCCRQLAVVVQRGVRSQSRQTPSHMHARQQEPTPRADRSTGGRRLATNQPHACMHPCRVARAQGDNHTSEYAGLAVPVKRGQRPPRPCARDAAHACSPKPATACNTSLMTLAASIDFNQPTYPAEPLSQRHLPPNADTETSRSSSGDVHRSATFSMQTSRSRSH